VDLNVSANAFCRHLFNTTRARMMVGACNGRHPPGSSSMTMRGFGVKQAGIVGNLMATAYSVRGLLRRGPKRAR
jgi:hypothetical protein